MAAAAILGVVTSLVGPAIEIGKCFQKQLNYLCCFQSNVKALDDAAKNLADAQADLQREVNGAENNGKPISNRVKTWLENANGTQQVMTLGIGTTLKPGIFNLKSRYSLSRKAVKTAQSMNQLRDTCNFDPVSIPTLPASMHHEERPQTPPAPGGGIDSRKKIEDDIIIAMRERNAYVIGVCGMGGVGKTTMAKQIMNRAKEHEGLFGEVLLVVVGQQVEKLKIQRDIADWLGLKFEEETLEPRARRLQPRLQDGKRKLIIIDDVWKRIDLEELGIPCQSDSCTILLTSRDRGVLRQMNAQRVFTVDILSEEDAWSMFQENVGAYLDDDPNLLPTARDIAKECKGLPLALVAVSRALKDQSSKGIWSDALKQLQSSNPMDVPGFIEDVYSPIRLSFNFLKNPHAESLWFLCSSFPDDYEISLEHLALYGFGLRILGDDIYNLEEARNRITGLVDMLKSRFLILHGKDERYVKMHDVVRDVAIFIVKEEKHAILDSTSLDLSKQNPHINDCSMLSVSQNHSQFDFHTGLILLKLSFLWMYNPGHLMSDNFLEGMQQLKVLSCVSFRLSPQTMILLKNLRTLHLSYCNLETLSAVGELSSLEILCCHSCDVITELPVEIGRLHRLRLLEVTYCDNLKTIVPGVISRLGQLEELKVFGCFTGWESQKIEKKGSNASLAELHSLSKLTCLEIEIEDWSLDAQVLQLSSKIVKYKIRVGESSLWEPTYSTRSHKKLWIGLQMCPSLVNWIAVFARTVEHLHLNGVDSDGFDFPGHQNLRCLEFSNCQTVVKLVRSASTDWGIGVFPVLEELYLSYLPMLDEICHGPIPDGFKNLRFLRINRCWKLRRVFSLSVVIRSLSQLETLEIENCESMEEVFWIEKDDGNSPSSCITFPKLETLKLSYLESLTHFCKGIDIIEFPQLVLLGIENCPKLKSFDKSTYDDNHVNSLGGHDSIHIFCNTKSTFGNLEVLTIENCVNMNNLFSYSVAANLVNLKKLTIGSCNEMVYVVTEDDAAETSQKKKHFIMFHKLEKLTLHYLPKLQNFCEASQKKTHIIMFHKLEKLTLHYLPKLQNFCEGRWDIQLPSLNELNIRKVGFHSARECVPLFCNSRITFNKLEYLSIKGNLGDRDHIKHLFSYSVAGNLVNLKTLSISHYKEMVYVIADDEDIAKTSENNPRTIFRKLEQLILLNLPKLQNFCEGRWDIQLPSLKKLNIDKVGFYSTRESVPLLCNAQITFDKLTELIIQGNLGDRDHIKHLFSYAVAWNLVNLQALKISNFSEMVYVIANDDDDIARTSHEKKPHIILFHKLEWFSLRDLPKLQNFCERRCDLQLPSLKQLSITNVGFYSGREYVPLVCNTQSTFDKLRYLTIKGNMGDGDEDIAKTSVIKHLFSYSVAGNLVNLELLHIYDFSEMVYVIADDDDIAKTSGNNPQIIFHQLVRVVLECLPKLQSLCDWGWDVQFPSLKDLSIRKCPGMKGVTPESIRKQNIGAVESRRQRVEVD